MAGHLEIEFDEQQGKRFHETMEKFYLDGPKIFGRNLVFVRGRLLRHVRAVGFSSSGPSSIGKGPGQKYGHVAASLTGFSHNIGWGGYVRLKFKKGGKGFVARFHEFGTGEMGSVQPNRKSKKTGRLYYAKGTGPGQGKNLRARNMLSGAYQSMDQRMIFDALDQALDKALK